MAENSVQRRLAAILAADVVGYSRLVGLDEDGTLAAVRTLRTEVIEPKIAEHQGRLFKTTGDGFLAEFASVVNAVACAVAVQQTMSLQNAEVPEDRRIELRIGIHLGDVVAEDGDVYGDGVNVAARIEALAAPGGVAISAMVHDNVGSRLDLVFEDLGEQQLKNIARPVRVHRLTNAARPAVQSVQPEISKPSIAVLPFTSMSGDQEQQFLNDGMAEDIITGLARFRHLDVAARNSSFRYRGDVDIRKAGADLGVQYIVEGSVRKTSNRLRITAQLIQVSSRKHVWADSYDIPDRDFFDVQDRVVQRIVATLVGRVTDASVHHAKLKSPGSLAAYELVLRANALSWETKEAKNEARQLLEAALQIDPQYATAYSLLAAIMLRDAAYHSMLTMRVLDDCVTQASQAVAIDDNDSACHSILGWVLIARGDFVLASEHIDRALQLNPNNPFAMINRGSLLCQTGQPDAAIELFQKVMSSDPFFNPSWCREKLGFAHFTARRYSDALDQLSRVSKKRFYMQALEAACQAKLGMTNAVELALKRTFALRPDCSIEIVTSLLPYLNSDDSRHLAEALALAGLQSSNCS